MGEPERCENATRTGDTKSDHQQFWPCFSGRNRHAGGFGVDWHNGCFFLLTIT